VVLSSFVFQGTHDKTQDAFCERLPQRIVLLLHGQSEANANHRILQHKPDPKVELTDLGKKQAEETGRKIRSLVGDENCVFYSFLSRLTVEQAMVSLEGG